MEEEEEEVVKRFGHVMASGCGGCDGGYLYLVVYIQLLSLSLSRRGIWQSSLLRTEGRLRSSAVRSDMSAAFLTVRVRQ